MKNENGLNFFNKGISKIHFAAVPADLPVLSHLFGVFHPGA
jgi:hypothetical protein